MNFEDWVLSGLAPVAQFHYGLSGSQTKSGACRSEGLITSKHVPDRGGELAGHIDLGDLGAALAAVAARDALVALPVEVVLARVGGGLHQPPAQVARPALRDRAAQVHIAGLADPRAQPRVADELDRRGEAIDISELARNREAGDRTEPGSCTLASTWPRHGSGISRPASSRRPPTPNRSAIGT